MSEAVTESRIILSPHIIRDLDSICLKRGISKEEAVEDYLTRGIAEDAGSHRRFLPKNLELPFFAYGMFRAGEIGFLRISSYVERVKPVSMSGTLYERDGVLLLDRHENAPSIDGHLIFFKSGVTGNAYREIECLEPSKLYKWKTTFVEKVEVNYLSGLRMDKNTIKVDEQFESWQDPLFVDALQFVELELAAEPAHFTLIKLQAAYLILWAAVERYASLRYGMISTDVMSKLKSVAEEPAFKAALYALRHEPPPNGYGVYRSLFSEQTVKWNPDDSIKTMKFFYQVRSNVAHRGKASGGDQPLLEYCIRQTLFIFKRVLKEGKLQATFTTVE